MPCNSDYMEASSEERYFTAVVQLLDELDGKPVNGAKFGDGYDPRIYNKLSKRKDLDALVAELCSRLQKTDVTKYSLEMQMWWRDHQRADAERKNKEEADRKQEAARKAALAKLTDAEKRTLGLK